MIIFVIVMGWTLLIMGGITYLLYKQKDYSLISGFSNRPEEEQEYLIENGYMEAIKRMMLHSTLILALLLVLGVLSVPYALEVGFAVFICYILGYTVQLQKYEVPHKRKRGYWITGSIALLVVGGITALTVYAFIPNQVTITEGHLEISGMYGGEWTQEEIQEVTLLEEMPPVNVRVNGFAMTNLSKGKFRVEGYGTALLFLRGDARPVLYVSTEDEEIFMNGEDEGQVRGWYEELSR